MLQTCFENEQLNSLPKNLTNHRTRNGFIANNRPDSSQLVDLHVYILPKSVWKQYQHLAQNAAMDDAISAGFVRVPPDMKLSQLRQTIEQSCGTENEFPREFIFLRSVGRCLARVRQAQEYELKVKHYRPPMTVASEIYIVEGRHEDHSQTTSASPAESSVSYLFGNRYQYRFNPDDYRRSTSRFARYDIHAEKQSISKMSIYDLSSGISSDNKQDWAKVAVTDSGELSSALSTLTNNTARELFKLHEEQERLRQRQAELERMRRAIEEKKLNTDHEDEECRRRRQQDKEQTEKRRLEQEASAATKIQAVYRGYKDRERYKKLKRNLKKDDIRVLSSKLNPLSDRDSIMKNEEYINMDDDEFSDSCQILSLSSSIESISDVDSSSSRAETEKRKKPTRKNVHTKPPLSSSSSSSSSSKAEKEIRPNTLPNPDIEETTKTNDEHTRSATVTKGRYSEDEILTVLAPYIDDEMYDLEREERENKRHRQLEDKRKAKVLEGEKRKTGIIQKKEVIQHEDVDSLRTRLQELRLHRSDLEKVQSEIIKNLKSVHGRIQLRRREARDVWKKKYFQEKKKTAPMEERSVQLKSDLDQIRKRTVEIIDKESKHSAKAGYVKSSEISNYISQITRTQHEIEEVRHQLDLAKLRLTTDIKLRNQAENESRLLKQELAQAKMNLKLFRDRAGV